MAIRGVLFDVDGTLYAFEGAEEAGLHEHLAAEGLTDRFASPAEALRVWREIKEEEYDRFLRGESTFTGQKNDRTRRFLAAAGVADASEMPDDAAAAWFATYAARKNTTRRAFDDAQPALDDLAARYRLGVVSNSATAHQRAKLEAIGLLGYFAEPLVCSQEHGAAKPAASIFLAGCEALGLAPAEVAYVGDNYETDAVGARDAGLRAIWLDRSAGGATGGGVGVGAGAGARIAPDTGIRVIASLTELERL
ncbi:HAD family hydrolase [Catenulispora sp. NF23]|uniref:HAD family hydrolase n=1 Tax=Catenulispora pinistramenti TaxID=2705254 RepID=UPI001BA8D3AF|nr:HAD family hydrolase [Catenulispora pinistramenti]MBS2537252.1 HAD family hydrolase [Catenulispora pinistramenti]